ncbi:N-acetylmuramoyl-L-alanine amidase [Chromohalobacter japonicus]|uniref:1,6-anhydro-N-acetylmuramyl-L-alanine amidase AmpD n=1 Tax=Chromohalobacter japonicus TaxID=223900 RepID=A0A1Q8T8X2_9GAMM|nr:1,6-anhydro-N-acetylmuramyl-L-alanine amidase AmpD [Chromohalobacter japonicus]OLO10122.1 N-acetylmuramoyl-L-alanine amidase [Chromohalobacter japonicus]
MQVDNHWLTTARHVVSPNHNARPEGEVSALVLHAISLPPGDFGGEAIERLFTNRLDPVAHPYFATIHALRVSAHVLIRRDGEAVQFVGFDRRAWHAGRSRWWDGQRERRELNDFSIGIELEGDEIHAYCDAQYRCLARVFVALRERYSALSIERVIGHAHIAPLRKTDPGPAFDWAYFRRCLEGAVDPASC